MKFMVCYYFLWYPSGGPTFYFTSPVVYILAFSYLDVYSFRFRRRLCFGSGNLMRVERIKNVCPLYTFFSTSCPHDNYLLGQLGMRFFCDTAMAGGSWVEIKHVKSISHDQQKTRCSKELAACWRNLIGLTPDATHHMEFTESALNVSTAPNTSADAGTQQRREIILDMDDQSDTSIPDEEDLPDFTQIKTKMSTWEQPNPNASGDPSLPSISGEATGNLIAPLRIVSLHVQCSGGGKMLPETNESSSASLVKAGRGRGRGRGRGIGRGKSESLVKPSTKGRASGEIGLGSPGNEETSVTDIEGLSNLVGGGSAIPSRDPVLVISHILRFRGDRERTRQIVFTYGNSPQQGALPGVEVRVFDSETAMLTAWCEFFYWEIDPDVVCVYQMKESLRYMAERFKVLKLGAFDIGRRKGQTTEVWTFLMPIQHANDRIW
jgi:hypothetical protein